MTNEFEHTPEKGKTYSEQWEDLKQRYEAGEDVIQEATDLLLKLHADQSQRLWSGQQPSEDAVSEKKIAEELEALIFL